jgi:hypothetical protein
VVGNGVPNGVLNPGPDLRGRQFHRGLRLPSRRVRSLMLRGERLRADGIRLGVAGHEKVVWTAPSFDGGVEATEGAEKCQSDRKCPKMRGFEGAGASVGVDPVRESRLSFQARFYLSNSSSGWQE